MAHDIWIHLGVQFVACFPASITVHELVVSEQVLKPDIGVVGAVALNSSGTLAGSGDAMPTGLVPLVNLHTNVHSKSARGWLHLPSPVFSEFVNRNDWKAAYKDAVAGLLELIPTGFDMGTFLPTHVNPVVYSRTRHTRGQSPYTFHLSNATLNSQPHWLRSRMDIP